MLRQDWGAVDFHQSVIDKAKSMISGRKGPELAKSLHN